MSHTQTDDELIAMTARDWLDAIIGAAALIVALFGGLYITWGMGL